MITMRTVHYSKYLTAVSTPVRVTPEPEESTTPEDIITELDKGSGVWHGVPEDEITD